MMKKQKKIGFFYSISFTLRLVNTKCLIRSCLDDHNIPFFLLGPQSNAYGKTPMTKNANKFDYLFYINQEQTMLQVNDTVLFSRK